MMVVVVVVIVVLQSFLDRYIYTRHVRIDYWFIE